MFLLDEKDCVFVVNVGGVDVEDVDGFVGMVVGVLVEVELDCVVVVMV